MRKNYNVYLLIFGLLISVGSSAQLTSTFDDLTLEENSYWNGSDASGSFVSGQATFNNEFNAEWYSWSGFAYSNIEDNTTAGYGNQYSAIPGMGAMESTNFGVCYTGSADTISFENSKDLFGIYVTNATYAALSMQEGDDYAKKFGGVSGDDADWFLLEIEAYNADMEPAGVVEFYLADYRFDNNEEDYILNDWEWVDLSSLKQVSFLTFTLTSSDNGDWGMNTPSYFCMDNLTVKDFTDINFSVSDGTNPIEGVAVDFAGMQLTTDINGEVTFTSVSPTVNMDISASKEGYIIHNETVNGYLVENVEITMLINSIESKSALNFSVFPNPATDIINVNSNSKITSISIYNLAGQNLIQQQLFDVASTSISLANLPLGVYLIEIKSDSGIARKQFIKQ
jgi:hypothetical protein